MCRAVESLPYCATHTYRDSACAPSLRDTGTKSWPAGVLLSASDDRNWQGFVSGRGA
jgi:hypothetical protein